MKVKNKIKLLVLKTNVLFKSAFYVLKGNLVWPASTGNNEIITAHGRKESDARIGFTQSAKCALNSVLSNAFAKSIENVLTPELN